MRFLHDGRARPTDKQRMRDHWYPLCDAGELTPEMARALTLFGDPLALFRDADGAPACVEDRCAHRSAPLSLGRVIEGCVECPYHGWRFDRGGACARVPSLGRGAPRVTASVRSYPCVERAGLVWVWPGDPSLVDDRAGAVFDALGGHRLVRGSRDLDVEHGLVIENLLDLAHSPFTHEGTLASRGDACGLDVATTEAPGRVAGTFRRTEDGCESAQSVAFEAPCVVRFETDLGWDERTLVQVHHAVPLARGRTRWTWCVARNWLRDHPQLDAALAQRAAAVVEQDATLLAAQQARVEQGAPLWGCEVPADRVALAYRAWRRGSERADTWFTRFGG